MPSFRRNSRGAICRVISRFEVDRAAGGFIEPVQQPEQGTLSRATGTDDGQHLSGLDFKGDVLDQDLVSDCAT